MNPVAKCDAHLDGFAEDIVRWQESWGRHGLPWQRERTPYRVWISETMLQQTQVATVIPYFERFMARFPSLPDLAKADSDDVLAAWSGLGYYRRARNLHACADIVAKLHSGKLPDTLEGLMALPGIGRSTAGAILSLASNRPYPVLDGNVRRVLIRLLAIDRNAHSAAVESELWQTAHDLLPQEKATSYAQGMMDLGATVCTARSPQCGNCPVQRRCMAFSRGIQCEIPIQPSSVNKTDRSMIVGIILCRWHALLARRPENTFWGGLWMPPSFETALQWRQFMRRHQLRKAAIAHSLPRQATAVLSHLKVRIHPRLACSPRRFRLKDAKWFPLDGLDRIGLPAKVRKLLASLGNLDVT